MRLRHGWALALLAGLDACQGRTPARIQLTTDTLAINTVFLEGPLAHVLDTDGREIPRAAITPVASSDSAVARVRGKGIQCRANGFTTVTLASGPASAALTVHCELIARFEPAQQVNLVAGGAAQLFGINAYDSSGRLIANPRLSLVNSDEKILRFRHGMVWGVRPGVATITATSGALSEKVVYVVRAPAARRGLTADSGPK